MGRKKLGMKSLAMMMPRTLKKELEEAKRKIDKLEEAQKRIAYLERELNRRQNAPTASNTNKFVVTKDAPLTYSLDVLNGEEDKLLIETDYKEDLQYMEEVTQLLGLEAKVVLQIAECEETLKELETSATAIRRKKENVLKKLKKRGWEQDPMEYGGVHFTKFVDVDE